MASDGSHKDSADIAAGVYNDGSEHELWRYIQAADIWPNQQDHSVSMVVLYATAICRDVVAHHEVKNATL